MNTVLNRLDSRGNAAAQIDVFDGPGGERGDMPLMLPALKGLVGSGAILHVGEVRMTQEEVIIVPSR